MEMPKLNDGQYAPAPLTQHRPESDDPLFDKRDCATSIATVPCKSMAGPGATDAESFVAGSRYVLCKRSALVAPSSPWWIVIVLVFSFFLKEDKITEK